MKFLNALLACGLALCALGAQAQTWPTKPVRIVVPFAAGSGTDAVARTVAEDLQKTLGVSVIVEDKPGASSQIAAEHVARAAPDGYTFLMSTNTAHSANPHLFRKLNYDPLKDLIPTARVNLFLFVLLVNANSPWKDVRDLVAAAKANPGKLNYGFGNSTGQVAGAFLAHTAGLQVTPIAYKSTPPALTDLASGQIDYMFVDLAASQSFIRSGRVRVIGIQSDSRSSLLPDIPAVGEVYPGFTFTVWGGLVAPAGTPRPILEKMNAATNKALANPAVREKLINAGLEPYPQSLDDFGKFLVEQHQGWGQRIRDAGMIPE